MSIPAPFPTEGEERTLGGGQIPQAALCQDRMALQWPELPPTLYWPVPTELLAGLWLQLGASQLPHSSPCAQRALLLPCKLQHRLAMPPWSLCLVSYNRRNGVPTEQPPVQPWGWFGVCTAAPVPQTCQTHNDRVLLSNIAASEAKVNPKQNKGVKKVHEATT